jgi:integrase
MEIMKRTDIKRRPLADSVLSALEPDDKEYRELDGNGLYFRVKPDGNKSWQLRYKKSDGKWSWLGLGSYPTVGGSLARKNAAELLADAAQGNNPIITKQIKKQAELEANNNTFENLAREWLDSKINKWVEGTMTRNKGALELHIFPIMGKRAYATIKPIEWMNLFQRIQKEKGIIEQSNRMRALCQEIYDLAKVTGRIDYNPLEGLHKFLETHKSESMKHVSAKELPALLRAIRNYSSRDVSIGLQLLTILFSRPSELREAVWSEFDFEERLWTIPAERMKRRIEFAIPLPVQAIDLLNELKYYSGESKFLFPSRSSDDKPKSETVFIMALRRLGYESRQSPHGFRHIASSNWNKRYSSIPQVVEAALAHLKQGVKGKYDKEAHLDERIPMQQWWADHLEALAGENIVVFPKVAG